MSWLSGRCGRHEIIALARSLSPEAFAQVREELAATSPLTGEERRERALRFALGRLEWTARDYKRARRSAEAAGATGAQIAEAESHLPVDDGGQS